MCGVWCVGTEKEKSEGETWSLKQRQGVRRQGPCSTVGCGGWRDILLVIEYLNIWIFETECSMFNPHTLDPWRPWRCFKLQFSPLDFSFSVPKAHTPHTVNSIKQGEFELNCWIIEFDSENLQRYLSLYHLSLHLFVEALHLIVDTTLASALRPNCSWSLYTQLSSFITSCTIWIPPHHENYSTIHLDCCTFLVSRSVIASTALRSFWFKIDTYRYLMSLSVISFSQACVVLPPKPNHPEKCITMILNFRHAIHHVPRELTR